MESYKFVKLNKKHLLVAATQLELTHFDTEFNIVAESPLVFDVWPDTQLLITGVGQYNAIFNLMQYINQFGPPRDIVNIGICGSFTEKSQPGTLVSVSVDVAASQIVEESEEWQTWQDAGLPVSCGNTFRPELPNWAEKLSLPEVRGITIDFITDDKLSIEKRKAFFYADVESMEGAGIFFVATKYKLPAIQIRCVSNFVGERNKSNWKLNESIGRLNSFLQTELKPLIT